MMVEGLSNRGFDGAIAQSGSNCHGILAKNACQ